MDQFNENNKILYVDDEQELLNSFYGLMRKEKFEIFTLQDSTKIDQMIEENGPFAVVLSDQRMPQIDGAQVLDKIKKTSPETPRILITGYSDFKDTIRAINIGGITSYISKPWDDTQLKLQVQEWVVEYNLKMHNAFLLNALDVENRKLIEVLDGTVAKSVRILGDFAKNVSPQIAQLGERVKTLGIAFLDKLPNISLEEKWEIKRALDLFNLGFVLLPATIQASIVKEGLGVLDLSQVAQNHHLLAAGLLKDIPRFGPVARIIELQGKDFDGHGEPLSEKVSGEEIPLGARLIHILVDLVRPRSVSVRGVDHLNKMRQLPNKYDVNLIRQILDKDLDIQFVGEEKSFPIAELKPGMVILNDVFTLEGQLLLKENVTLNETYINILTQWHSKEPISEPIKVRSV